MKPYTVLVPSDGSEFSWQIIPYICRLLIPREHTIILLRVEQPLLDFSTWSSQSGREPPASLPDWITKQDPELTPHPDSVHGALDSLRASLIASMQPSRSYLEDAGFTVVSDVRFGEPVEELVRYAEEAKVDLVAMATHGRSGLSRLTMGSTADAVMRRSHIPVLMVRPAVTPTHEHTHVEVATEPA